MRQKDPLRPLTNAERRALEQLARSHSAPALSVARARALLGVSDGCSYTEAAQLVGRAVGDSISLAVLFMGGFAPLGAMGIFGAAKVGLAWGLVLGGYVGLMLKVRQEELAPSSRHRLPTSTR